MKKKKCKCQKKRRNIRPYGLKNSKGWCDICDKGPRCDIDKKNERFKAKREIARYLTDSF